MTLIPLRPHLRQHRTAIREILAEHGLTDVRIAATRSPLQLIVRPDDDVSLDDFVDAEDALATYLGEEVELVPTGSELWSDVHPGSVAL